MENNSWYKIRNLLIIFITLLLCSCYKTWDLNDYDNEYDRNKPDSLEYFWYYNKELFKNAEYCQLIGGFESSKCNRIYYVNKRCIIYDYIIYPRRKNINKNDSTYTCDHCKIEHNIYNGKILINNVEHFVKIKLK